MDVAALQLFGNQYAVALHYHGQTSTWLATQLVAHVFGRLAVAVHTVHCDKSVTRHQSALGGRHSLVWITHIDIAVALHDDSSNAAVLASGHHA